MINKRNISESHDNDGQDSVAAKKNGSATGSSSERNSLQDNICSNRSSMDVSTCSYNTLIIHPDDNLYTSLLNASNESANREKSLSYDQNGMQEITEIPDDYLNQSHVLKHLAKEIKVPNNRNQTKSNRSSSMRLNNATPPKYEYMANVKKNPRGEHCGSSNINRLKNHNENKNYKSRSKSQPDLTKTYGWPSWHSAQFVFHF